MTAAARRLPWLGSLLVVAIVLGGCGGGDDDAKIETKADFIAAGDKICVERDRRSAKLTTAAGNDGDVARLTGALAGIYATAIERLRALALPKGAARAGARTYLNSVAAMRTPVQRMKASSARLAAAARSASAKTVQRRARSLQLDLNTVQAIGDVADQNARRYGFRDCGQQQPPPAVPPS